jgi:hypothetical protein
MTQLQLETLENSVGKAVAITCADGDTLRGTVAYVDDEYRDVTCDLFSSNRPEKYGPRGQQQYGDGMAGLGNIASRLLAS